MWNFIATLAKTYFSARFAARTNRNNRTKKQPARPAHPATKTTCTSAYYPRRKSIPIDEPHTVHVYRIILSFPSLLTEQEEKRLAFLRHLIEIGEVTEEI